LCVPTKEAEILVWQLTDFFMKILIGDCVKKVELL
jgi:hypothetical protein